MGYSIKQVHKILSAEISVPLFLWGDPGIGKTDVVRQVCAEKGKKCITIMLSLMDPTDLRGLPCPNTEKKQTVWMKPEFLPTTSGSVLFFDELTHAPKSVQSAAYQLILEGRVGEHELPSDTIRIAASNKPGAGMLGNQLPLPLRNRFIHIDVDHNYQDWIEWAENIADLDNRVTGYIRSKPDALKALPTGKEIRDTYSFPTPRTWHYVAKSMTGRTMSDHRDIVEPLIKGAVGPRLGTEFSTYLKTLESFVSPEDLLNDPSKLKKNADPSVLWSIMGSLSAIVTPETRDNYSTILLNKDVPREIAMYSLRSAIEKYKRKFVLSTNVAKEMLKQKEFRIAVEATEGKI